MTTKRAGRKAIYDWAKWFKRSSFTLQQGKDYRCSTSMIIRQIRNAAMVHAIGKRISITGIEGDDGQSLTVRVRGRTETLR